MKLLGTVFLAAGSFLLWQKRIVEERRKTKAIKEMAQAVSFMAGEIRCRLVPLPKLVRLCHERYGGAAAVFFASVEKDLKSGFPLQKAWEKALIGSDLPDGSAKEAFAGLGTAFGHDEETVLRHLEETQRRLKEELEIRRREQKEKEKLWTVLCASGAGLLWLMIV